MDIKARFDCVGKFKNGKGEIEDAKRAHYIFGNSGTSISGGLYLPKDFPFPEEGITITLMKGEKDGL